MRAMWPIERSVVPPILRTRSAMRIGHGEDLVGLLVQQQVVVAEVRAAHVPVEVLGLQVEREDVGEHGVHGAGDVLGRLGLEVGRSDQRSLLQAFKMYLVSIYKELGIVKAVPGGEEHQGSFLILTWEVQR